MVATSSVRRRRPLCWFALVLILSGTPARQVEAADDFARTMAELDEDDRRVEEVDGGVGDDSLDATRADAPGHEVAPGPSDRDAGPGWPIAAAVRPPGWSPPAPPPRSRPPHRSGRRQAQLGRFLF